MRDGGFLLSAGAVLIVLLLFGRTRRPDEPTLSEAAFWPTAVGLLVGRLVALGIDDTDSLRSMSNLLLLRGGVELWPGVLAGTLAALAIVRIRHRSVATTARLLVPSAVAAWATYDLACLIRDGCPGPSSPIGLRPPGLTTTQLPVSLIAGLAGLGAAVLLRKAAPRRGTARLILTGLLVTAALRSIESIWLPSLASGLSRPWSESLVVLAVSSIGLLAPTLRARWAPRGSRGVAEEREAPDGQAPTVPTRLDAL